MFGRREIVEQAELIQTMYNRFELLVARVKDLENDMAVTKRRDSPLHCKCGRYVGMWISYVWGSGYRWYDRGKEPAVKQTLCPDCLTQCGPGDKTEQLQRKGKAK